MRQRRSPGAVAVFCVRATRAKRKQVIELKRYTAAGLAAARHVISIPRPICRDIFGGNGIIPRRRGRICARSSSQVARSPSPRREKEKETKKISINIIFPRVINCIKHTVVNEINKSNYFKTADYNRRYQVGVRISRRSQR